MYEALYNKELGIIVALDLKSPKRESPEIQSPRLQAWSDLTFLEYAKLEPQTLAPMRGLQGVLHWHLMEDYDLDSNDALDTIKEAMGLDETIDYKTLLPHIPPWPGTTFPIENVREEADIMRTPQGKGLGWLLLQHQNEQTEFGKKRIASWTVFRTLSGEYEWANIFFHIEDIPPPM